MKHMILTFKMKGDVDVISDHFLMPWFQKDSLGTVDFKTYVGGSRVLNQKSDILNPKCAYGRGHWFRTKS